MKCVVKNCVNRDSFKSERQQAVEARIGVITYHTFPSNEEIRQKWINFVYEKSWKPAHDSSICSQHFEKNCFDNFKSPNREMYPYAVPTIPVQVIEYMVYQCYVPGCKNNYRTRNVQLIQFPQEGTNTLEFQKWVENIMNFNGATEEHIGKLTSQSKICSEHFEKKCFVIVNGKSFLRSGSVPTLCLPGKPLHQNPFENEDEVDVENSIRINKVPKCAISSCQSTFTDPAKAFFPFPTDLSLNLIWTQAVKDYNKTNNFEYLCSDHFFEDDFEPNTKKKFLKYGSIPTLFPTPTEEEYITEIFHETLIDDSEPLNVLYDQDSNSNSETIESNLDVNHTDLKTDKRIVETKTKALNSLKRNSRSNLQNAPPKKIVLLDKSKEKDKKILFDTNLGEKFLTPISKDKIPNNIKKIIASKKMKKDEINKNLLKNTSTSETTDDFHPISISTPKISTNTSTPVLKPSILKSILNSPETKSIITRSASTKSALSTSSKPSTIRPALTKSTLTQPLLVRPKTRSTSVKPAPTRKNTSIEDVEKDTILDKYYVKIPERVKKCITIAAADSTNNIEKSNQEKVEDWLNDISDEDVSSTNVLKHKKIPKILKRKRDSRTKKINPFSINVNSTEKLIINESQIVMKSCEVKISEHDQWIINKKHHGNEQNSKGNNKRNDDNKQNGKQNRKQNKKRNSGENNNQSSCENNQQNSNENNSQNSNENNYKNSNENNNKNSNENNYNNSNENNNKNSNEDNNKNSCENNKQNTRRNRKQKYNQNKHIHIECPDLASPLVPLNEKDMKIDNIYKKFRPILPAVTPKAPNKKRKNSENNDNIVMLNSDPSFITCEINPFDTISLVMDESHEVFEDVEQNDPLAIDDPPKEDTSNNSYEIQNVIKIESPSPHLLSEEEYSLLVPYYEEPIIEGQKTYRKSPIKKPDRISKNRRRFGLTDKSRNNEDNVVNSRSEKKLAKENNTERQNVVKNVVGIQSKISGNMDRKQKKVDRRRKNMDATQTMDTKQKNTNTKQKIINAGSKSTDTNQRNINTSQKNIKSKKIIDLTEESSVSISKSTSKPVLVKYSVDHKYFTPKCGHNIITRQKTKKINTIDPFIIKKKLKRKYDYKITSMVPKIILKDIFNGKRPAFDTIKIRVHTKLPVNNNEKKTNPNKDGTATTTNTKQTKSSSDREKNINKKSVASDKKSVRNDRKSVKETKLDENDKESVMNKKRVGNEKKSVGNERKSVGNERKLVKNETKLVANKKITIKNESIKNKDELVKNKLVGIEKSNKKKSGRTEKSSLGTVKNPFTTSNISVTTKNQQAIYEKFKESYLKEKSRELNKYLKSVNQQTSSHEIIEDSEAKMNLKDEINVKLKRVLKSNKNKQNINFLLDSSQNRVLLVNNDQKNEKFIPSIIRRKLRTLRTQRTESNKSIKIEKDSNTETKTEEEATDIKTEVNKNEVVENCDDNVPMLDSNENTSNSEISDIQKIDFKNDIQKYITPRKYKIKFISDDSNKNNELVLNPTTDIKPKFLGDKTADVNRIKNKLKEISGNKRNLKVVKVFRNSKEEYVKLPSNSLLSTKSEDTRKNKMIMGNKINNDELIKNIKTTGNSTMKHVIHKKKIDPKFDRMKYKRMIYNKGFNDNKTMINIKTETKPITKVFDNEIIKRTSEIFESNVKSNLVINPVAKSKPNIIDPELKIKNVSKTYERKKIIPNNIFPRTIKMDISKYSKYKFMSLNDSNFTPKFNIVNSKSFISENKCLSSNKTLDIKPTMPLLIPKIEESAKILKPKVEEKSKTLLSYENIVNEIFGDDTDDDFAIENFIKDTMKKEHVDTIKTENVDTLTKENVEVLKKETMDMIKNEIEVPENIVDFPSTSVPIKSSKNEVDTDDECYDIEYLESDIEDNVTEEYKPIIPEINNLVTETIETYDNNEEILNINKTINPVNNTEILNINNSKLTPNQLPTNEPDSISYIKDENNYIYKLTVENGETHLDEVTNTSDNLILSNTIDQGINSANSMENLESFENQLFYVQEDGSLLLIPQGDLLLNTQEDSNIQNFQTQNLSAVPMSEIQEVQKPTVYIKRVKKPKQQILQTNTKSTNIPYKLESKTKRNETSSLSLNKNIVIKNVAVLKEEEKFRIPTTVLTEFGNKEIYKVDNVDMLHELLQ